jgi:hypothetical protein
VTVSAAPRLAPVLAGALVATLLGCACGPSARGTKVLTTSTPGAPAHGVEVHEAGGRPRLVVVRRDGDPRAGIAIEIRVPDAYEDASARVAALAALVSARLGEGGLSSIETLSGARVARVRGLVRETSSALAEIVDAKLKTPVGDADPALPAVAAALDAFAARPVVDASLARAERCLDRPVRPASFAKIPREKLAATVEAWRLAAMRADGVVLGVVASGLGLDAFAERWSALDALRPPAGLPPVIAPAKAKEEDATVGHAGEGGLLVVDGAGRGAVPSAIAALADRTGALALRLEAAYDWRLRGVAGVSWPEGGCVVVEVEPGPASSRRGARVGEAKEWNLERFTMHAAYALEVARQESELALETARVEDGEAARLAIGRGGDPREAADRAAWWGWSAPAASVRTASSVLSLPLAVIAKGPQIDVDAVVTAARTKFVASLDRARIAWARGELEAKGRVEAGQGEVWVALGSPCGVSWETTLDAGLARVAIQSLAASVAPRGAADGVEIEPWASTVGVGLVAHAAARPGESPKALALRVGDLVGRAFLTGFPANEQVAVARGEAVSLLSDPVAPGPILRPALTALVPEHPSFIDALGAIEPVAKIGGEGVELRLSTLRGGPLRLAVLANAPSVSGVTAEADQVDAATRAAERWVPRLPGETRACPAIDLGAAPKGALHVVHVAAGTGIAITLPVDEADRDAAAMLAAVLDGPGGRLEAAFSAQALATAYEARLVRGAGRSALAIVVLAPAGNLDAVAAAVRGLLERLHTAGPDEADRLRADARRAQASMQRRLDPRGRLVDLFLGEPSPPPAVELPRLRAVAARVLAEDHLQLVVARLPK